MIERQIGPVGGEPFDMGHYTISCFHCHHTVSFNTHAGMERFIRAAEYGAKEPFAGWSMIDGNRVCPNDQPRRI